jgi:hypothetical protein
MSNVQIVTTADEVVAFWDGNSQGTLATINVAREYAKPVKTFGPDGEVLE